MWPWRTELLHKAGEKQQKDYVYLSKTRPRDAMIPYKHDCVRSAQEVAPSAYYFQTSMWLC